MKNMLPFIVLFVGLILSVVLHESFHIVMHWGNIEAIQLFPPSGNVAQVVTGPLPNGYNVMNEELIAYSITTVVLVITLWVFVKMILKGDRRRGKILLSGIR